MGKQQGRPAQLVVCCETLWTHCGAASRVEVAFSSSAGLNQVVTCSQWVDSHTVGLSSGAGRWTLGDMGGQCGGASRCPEAPSFDSATHPCVGIHTIFDLISTPMQFSGICDGTLLKIAC